jgi:hypothetical protein
MTLFGLLKRDYFSIRQTSWRRAMRFTNGNIPNTPTKKLLLKVRGRKMSTIASTYLMTSSRNCWRKKTIWSRREMTISNLTKPWRSLSKKRSTEQTQKRLEGVQLGGLAGREEESEELAKVRFNAIPRILFGIEGPSIQPTKNPFP